MSAAAVNRLESGHETERADCGMVALAAYLEGVTYPEVIRAAALTDRDAGRSGLWRKTLVRMAAGFGVRLVIRRRFDFDDDYGVIVTAHHAAVLRNGLVLDRCSAWDWQDWLKHQHATVAECVLLVVKE